MKKIVILIISITLIIGCNRMNNDSTKIGVILPLSGPISMGGTRVLEGIKLAISDFNTNNPQNKVELIIEDSRGEPKEGVNAINKLINQDKIKFIIGDLTSGVTLAIAPIAEKNKILLLAPGASNPKVKEAGDFIFRNWVSDDFDGMVAASYIIDSLKLSSAYVLNIQNDYGIGLSSAFINTFKNKNGVIIGQESYLTTQTDFKSIIAKISDLKFDVIYIAGQPKDIGYIMRQMEEVGFKRLTFSNASVEEKDFITIADKLNTEIYYTSPVFNLEDSSKIVRNFVSLYEKNYGNLPDIASAHGYDAANILLKCLTKKETSSSEAKEILYRTPIFKGVTGDFSFDENGDAIKGINVKKLNKEKESILLGYYNPNTKKQ